MQVKLKKNIKKRHQCPIDLFYIYNLRQILFIMSLDFRFRRFIYKLFKYLKRQNATYYADYFLLYTTGIRDCFHPVHLNKPKQDIIVVSKPQMDRHVQVKHLTL